MGQNTVTDTLERLKTALADRYAIEREIGAGGMATVYLAEDLRHGRKVAVKVLRPDLAATLGPERFLREIEIAARLEHPHILTLIDSGEADSFLYYVMPYVEGDSLRTKLGREQELPVSEAVRILSEVVDGLAYAHERGVVHRDIKPDNVLLSGGHAVITDFGVAKAVSEATGRHELTSAGVALGTPAYMSPEQASAASHIDYRSDIYSIGAMAYEMLAGRPPFSGNTSQIILAAHVTETPDPLSKHRAAVSRELEHLVMKCLEKRPADRWQTSREMLPLLAAAATPSAGVTPTDTRPVLGVPGLRLPARKLLTVAVPVAAIAAAALLWPGRAPPTLRTGRVTHVTTAPGLEVDPAISPDATRIAYAAGTPGHMKIYLRQIDGARTITLAEGLDDHHRLPRWSPDGTRIAFQAGADFRESAGGFRSLGGTIYAIPALGGSPRRLVEPSASTSVFGPTWSPDGQSIAFVRDQSIVVAPIDGSGEPRVLVEAEQPHSPRWSPDGERIAYISGNPQFTFGAAQIANVAPSSLWVVPVTNGEPVRVTANQAMNLSPVWTPDSRHLLFISNQDGSRDIYRIRLGRAGGADGEPERLTTGLSAQTIDLAADGRTLAYSVYTSYAHIWYVPIPQRGAVSVSEARQITTASESIEGLAISPDGRWIVYDSDRSGNFDVWKISVDGGDPEAITTHSSDDFVQQWSPDGTQLAIHSFRNGTRDVFVMASEGGGVEPVTTGLAHELNPTWSPDGNSVAFQSNETGQYELYVSSRQANGGGWGEPRQLTTDGGGVDRVDPYWSPDGNHIAYISDRAIRIISPTGTDERVLLQSRDPDVQPAPEFAIWSADSRTIYFKAYDTQRRSSLWSVPAEGGEPRLLVRFDDPSRPSLRREFATDGERFFFTVARHESDIWVMELLTN